MTGIDNIFYTAWGEDLEGLRAFVVNETANIVLRTGRPPTADEFSKCIGVETYHRDTVIIADSLEAALGIYDAQEKVEGDYFKPGFVEEKPLVAGVLYVGKDLI